MKKIANLIILFVAAFVLVSPMVAKADIIPLKGDVYSKYVTVGSEFISSIEVGQNNFSGIVTFDNNVLEFVKIESIYSGHDDVYGGNKGKVTNTLNGNSISISYTKGDYPENVLITFKVKSYPSNGVATIKVTANSNQWFGEISKSINVLKNEECPTCPICKDDEVSCPVCEECQECETNNNVVNNDNSENTNMLLYASLGACGILLAAVLILAIRKK